MKTEGEAKGFLGGDNDSLWESISTAIHTLAMGANDSPAATEHGARTFGETEHGHRIVSDVLDGDGFCLSLSRGGFGEEKGAGDGQRTATDLVKAYWLITSCQTEAEN